MFSFNPRRSTAKDLGCLPPSPVCSEPRADRLTGSQAHGLTGSRSQRRRETWFRIECGENALNPKTIRAALGT